MGRIEVELGGLSFFELAQIVQTNAAFRYGKGIEASYWIVASDLFAIIHGLDPDEAKVDVEGCGDLVHLSAHKPPHFLPDCCEHCPPVPTGKADA